MIVNKAADRYEEHLIKRVYPNIQPQESGLQCQRPVIQQVTEGLAPGDITFLFPTKDRNVGNTTRMQVQHKYTRNMRCDLLDAPICKVCTHFNIIAPSSLHD